MLMLSNAFIFYVGYIGLGAVGIVEQQWFYRPLQSALQPAINGLNID